jgi:hypothetical protein
VTLSIQGAAEIGRHLLTLTDDDLEKEPQQNVEIK